MSVLSNAAASVLQALPRASIGRFFGGLAERPWSPAVGRRVVGAFSRAFDVRLDEAAQTSGWPTFDAFFTRPLREGARAVDAGDGVVVSPSDGRLDVAVDIDSQSTLLVKGSPYRVRDLVGSAEDAARYEGGVGCVVYLSPRDYHRVHSPVEGVVSLVRSLPGDFFPVNDFGAAHVPGLFTRNRRVAICIDTPEAVGLGRVTVVMVAALIVGRVTVSGIDARDVPLGDHVLEPGRAVRRGEELGMFHLGSTVVLLLEPRAKARCQVQVPARVRYGERLLTACTPTNPPAPRAG
jgi:phosphatidylserine decarboxylase